MYYKRDSVLDDLRRSVMAISLEAGENHYVIRCTMMLRHLPKKYLDEQKGERDFHENHPNIIKCWDIENKKWVSFDAGLITYCEEVTDRY
jgi:hypothetical protein